MPPMESHTEKKYLDSLLADLNNNLLAGLDTEPNLSRSSKKPEMYLGFREGTVDSGIFFGGSNATKLAASASTLGLDAYRMASGGWKLSKENVDKVVNPLTNLLTGLPQTTPAILFCLDNSVFRAVGEDGSMLPICKDTGGDGLYHVKGTLVVAPERAILGALGQLQRVVDVLGNRPKFIVSPIPRYVSSPCCNDTGHITNRNNEDFLTSILADLALQRYQLRRVFPTCKIVDGLELICGKGYTRDKVEQAVLAGWSADPVHPNCHIYAKMALNLLDLIATEGQEVADEQGDWMEARGYGSSFGGGKWSSKASKRSNNWHRKRGELQGKNTPAHTGEVEATREVEATATTQTAGTRTTKAADMAGPTNKR